MTPIWQCALCGATNTADGPMRREGLPCERCGSTWRIRSIIVTILHAIGAPMRPLPDQVPDWSRRGIGCSDQMGLAAALSACFDYTNTFYHRFPKVDLFDPPADLRDELHFVVCSDVLEHVPTAPEVALAGLHSMLRYEGFVALSVPVTEDGGPTREFYPGLTTFSARADHSLDWTDVDGVAHHDPNPRYHGGPGQTLAFRVWGTEDLAGSLRDVGFRHVVEPPFAPDLGVPPLDHHGAFLAYR